MSLRAVLFGSLTFCLVNLSVSAQAQTATAPPDTTAAIPVADAKPVKHKGLSKPGRAALYSAIIPGAGQFYNRDYWKVPVVYAVGGTCYYFLSTNNSEFQRYQNQYRAYIRENPTLTTSSQANYLRLQRDYYRRNRDLTFMLSILAYGMQIMEATVGAHMNEFDISDDLSMNWQPSLQTTFPGSAPVPALSFNFRFTR